MRWMLAAVLLAACGVRAPAALDVDALVRAKGGQVQARLELVIRTQNDPKDIQARLALAALDEQMGLLGDAIVELDIVEKMSGPVGVRWHDRDKVRFRGLLVQRAIVRIDRGANGLDDLEHATKLGAKPDPAIVARAKAAVALAHLRHVDEGERAKGRAMLAALVKVTPDQAWAGALPNASPEQHGAFGVWLWEHGAKREAYEQLAVWKQHATSAENSELVATYQRALEWWSPDAAIQVLTTGNIADDSAVVGGRVGGTLAAPKPEKPGDVGVRPHQPPPPPPPEPPPPPPDPRADAAATYAQTRLALMTDAGLGQPHPVSAEMWWPPYDDLRAVAHAFREDPAIADRKANTLVDHAADAALAHAALGALFDALGDPARARAFWLAASEESNEAPILAGYAESAARAGDGDAALVIASSAAAASGDPAATYVDIARALLRGNRSIDALTASKLGLDLAGSNTLIALLDLAIKCSNIVGRTDQATALAARRAPLHPAIEKHEARDLLMRELETASNASTLAAAWVATRDDPYEVEMRAALLHLLEPDDSRRAQLERELTGIASLRDQDRALSAVLALP
ncbi:MAG: hypothetical protein QM831_41515 [Kofleriaceae bacterium]